MAPGSADKAEPRFDAESNAISDGFSRFGLTGFFFFFVLPEASLQFALALGVGVIVFVLLRPALAGRPPGSLGS